MSYQMWKHGMNLLYSALFLEFRILHFTMLYDTGDKVSFDLFLVLACLSTVQEHWY